MNICSKDEIEYIVSELKHGKTVAFGTDTVFGLSCITGNQETLDKIYKIKKRDINKKIPLMFSGFEMMNKYTDIDNKTEKLIKYFNKGPITYILKERESNSTIACRIPDDPWIIELINLLNKPLYVTSANISNEKELIHYEDVVESLKDVDIIVKKDAEGKSASTIIDTTNDYKILREGPVSKEEIEKILNENII